LLDNTFQFFYDVSLKEYKKARETHTKNKTLVKNFANAVLFINEFINDNPEYQHAFKSLLDKRGLTLPSTDEINKSLKEQEQQESERDKKKVIDYYNGKFYGL